MSEMSDSLRDRIAAVIDREVDGLWEPLDVADAVVDFLTKYLPPIFASAIHAYADAELARITHHGSPDEYAMLKQLNDHAANIANYATTHEKWNGNRQ